MELGGTCTLGTTRCLESWVLLSMRLFQSSKSTVLRDKAHQQSRQPEILGPTTWLYPQVLGLFGDPTHTSPFLKRLLPNLVFTKPTQCLF